MATNAKIERVEASAYVIPTETPEADGTIEWNSTTLVLVRAYSQGVLGLGYTYADASAAQLIASTLAPIVAATDAFDTAANWLRMARATRNIGRPGIASMAISAVDCALWDLKARLLDVSLISLLGAARAAVPAYGSGGFTSYSIDKLQAQLSKWVSEGMRFVKMKVGANPSEDLGRVRAARMAIGLETELFVDANGAYSRKQALTFAERFAELSVTWFEEPVSSDDLDGLRLLRDRSPPEIRIASGEYGFDAFYFRRMLEAQAVDVLQADATRCGGVTGFLQAAEICNAFGLPLSAHTAPTLHAHLACAAHRGCNVEYFFDHARIEQFFFNGALIPIGGMLVPDRARPGLGLELKTQEARRFAA